jgi:hypothetical protein
MIRIINKIENVRRFRCYENENADEFQKLTVIYGLNGTGKTTLASIFRSLKTGDSKYIMIPQMMSNIQGAATAPRQQALTTTSNTMLSSQYLSIEIISNNGANISHKLENGMWSKTSPEIEIFDIHFCNLLFSGAEARYDKLNDLLIGDRCNDLRMKIVDGALKHFKALRQKLYDEGNEKSFRDRRDEISARHLPKQSHLVTTDQFKQVSPEPEIHPDPSQRLKLYSTDDFRDTKKTILGKFMCNLLTYSFLFNVCTGSITMILYKIFLDLMCQMEPKNLVNVIYMFRPSGSLPKCSRKNSEST